MDTLDNEIQAAAASAAEELSPDEAARRGEHFIPLRKADLVELLAERQSLSDEVPEQFRRLCRLIEAALHAMYHDRLQMLKEAYAPFDPDADAAPRASLGPTELDARTSAVFGQFVSLLERANFRRLPQEEIEAAIRSASQWGFKLKIDFSIFERLEVFARGDVIGKQLLRRWLRPWRTVEIEVPTYQRLAVIFRLQPGARLDESPAPIRPIVLKLFKNIPKADVEILLPGSRVTMSLWDQGRIWVPTVTGFGLVVYKLVGAGAMLTLASLWSLAALYSLAAGAIGYGVKTFFSYSTTKDKHQLKLTRSLYFQNLDSNAGVLFRLLDEAEEQEFRETVLAWWVLWRHGRDGWTARQVDRAVERFLRRALDLGVDFEILDALEKLRRLRLVESVGGGRWKAVDLAAAAAELENLPALSPLPLTKRDALRRLMA
jgi:uncharacterized protein DUF3754